LKRDVEKHTSYQRHILHTTGVNALNHNWYKLKRAHTCPYYDQVARFPLSRAIKSFRELHIVTIYHCCRTIHVICIDIFPVI